MEKRKNPEKDLSSKQGLFFNTGLLMAMMLCVAAFEYEVEEKIVHVPDLDPGKVELYLPPVTTHKIPEPPKPRTKLPDPTRVKEEEPEPLDLEPFKKPEEDKKPNDLLGEPFYTENMPDEKLPDEPFNWVEEMPSPKGGYQSFYEFVSKNLKYPAMARRMDISGKVYAQFVIDENGNIIDIEIAKGIGAGCDEEVKRLLAKAPKWNPGKQRGVPVKVKTILPIEFRLD